MRFLENKTEKIINGIFLGGIVYFIGYILIYLASSSTESSLTGHYIAVGMLYLGTFCKPIGMIVIFKFLCDVLYKILKTLDKYNNEQ